MKMCCELPRNRRADTGRLPPRLLLLSFAGFALCLGGCDEESEDNEEEQEEECSIYEFEENDWEDCYEGLCDPSAVCTDFGGPATCTCNPGWSGDGFTCQDTDECQQASTCDPTNGTCTNLVGSYECGCQASYTLALDSWTCLEDGDVIQVSRSPFNTCTVTTDGVLDCWGDDAEGQSSPPPGTYSSVAQGANTCALDDLGEIVCWGPFANAPDTNIPSGSFVSLVGSESMVCALDDDNHVTCFGPEPGAELFSKTDEELVQIDVNWSMACGIRTDGTVACWKGSQSSSDSPIHGSFSQIDLYDYYACAITADTGVAACFYTGWDSSDWSFTHEEEGPFKQVSLGGGGTGWVDWDDSACGVLVDGGVTCWETEHGYTFDFNDPFPGEYTQISLASYYGCAATRTGEIECVAFPDEQN